MIRVLVVDDNADFRRVLADLLGRHPDIEVVGAAGSPRPAAISRSSPSPSSAQLARLK